MLGLADPSRLIDDPHASKVDRAYEKEAGLSIECMSTGRGSLCIISPNI